MSSLDGQNVVVIGGTSGIGLAAAIAAKDEGARVWAVSRSEDKVKQCAADYPDIEFGQLDIHDVEGLNALFSRVGDIDHIVANATGANRTNAPFMEQSDEQFRAAFEKFWGYTNVARQGVPHLKETGSLTFVSGFPARKCNVGMSSISCTGCAVEGLTRALALEVAPIRVNVVAPGIIDTATFAALGDNKQQVLEQIGQGIPLGRVGESEEVALSILHAMQNSYMSGATLDVGGGNLLP